VSYDRVADNYVAMGVGEPCWLTAGCRRAALWSQHAHAR